ncbi:MAG TPA: hypothetical protein PLL93_13965, partial [bacterium]|nr:hypothetical protein [bacterium]
TKWFPNHTILPFPTSENLRRWFEKYHGFADELVVGYYKKATGKPSITWQDSVDQALCFGWIDSIRHKINAEAFQNRFTPRKPGSIWSGIQRDLENSTKKEWYILMVWKLSKTRYKKI